MLGTVLVAATATVSVVSGHVLGKKHERHGKGGCLKKDPTAEREWIPAGMEGEVPRKKYADMSSLASSLDWRFNEGALYAGASTNQHMPNYCGSCWAFSTTSALSDRIMIAKRDEYYEVNLAPQVLLDCDNKDDGCHGGDPLNALSYISKYGITEIGCTQYLAEGHDTGRQCTESSLCMTCSPGKTGCYKQYPYMRFGISAYGSLSGEDEYLQAVQDGPIVTGMCVTDEVENYIGTFYILNDTSGCTQQDHAVSIVGYGTEDGTPYWIVRNSWGMWWGQNGYFRVVRGTNNLGIEMDGTWATPVIEPTWVNTSSEVLGPVTIDDSDKTVKKQHQRRVAERPPFDDWQKYGGELVLSPRPSDTISDSDLPSQWVWNNINGTNWLTKSVNQHIPVYCGSCWAQATCSSLSDRLNIQRSKAGEIWFPEVHLSPQVLINNDGGGTCSGGNGIGALTYIHNYGIPDDTCQVYQARNDPHGSNVSLNECYTCSPGNTTATFTPGTCAPIAPSVYQNYYVSEYGRVIGAAEMKKEIYARGPITCGIDATPEFEDYTGGIYSQDKRMPMINHDISVVGWGVENGQEFWVGRNSWGTFWGEDGYFRITMHRNNLGIERECVWGVPTTVKPDVKDHHRFRSDVKHI